MRTFNQTFWALVLENWTWAEITDLAEYAEACEASVRWSC